MQILRVFAVLFGLMAISNLTKPLELAGDHGFVFFGRRLSDTPNLIAGLAFGTYLAFYAEALWRKRSHALPMAIAYAGYVCVNMALFTMRSPELVETSKLFGITYIVVAAGTSLGAVAATLSAGVARDAAPYEVLLKSFAILFGLMALSNCLKQFTYTNTTGFVLFGARTTGMTNVIASLSMAAFLVTYAQAIWTEKRRALTLGAIYAAYVLVNLVLWNFRKPDGTETPMLFGIFYLIIAIGVSSGSAALLYRVRERLAR
jgi:hypothetical protein